MGAEREGAGETAPSLSGSASDAPDANATQRLSVDEALAIAVRAHQAGMLEPAAGIYRQVLAAMPDHADALHFLGIIMHQQGQVHDAIGLVRRAVELAPEHVDARNNLGNMLHESDLLAEAEETYREVLARRPNHAGAQTNLGIVLKKRGDRVGAEAAFRRAIEIDPSHGEAYHNLGNVLRDTGRSEEALSAFQRALILRPYDGDSYRYVGALLSALGRLEQAADVYHRWLEMDPENPVPRHLYAACSSRDVPGRASDAFVKQTFDGFAKSFDTTLRERLSYRAPELVAEAIEAVLGAPQGTLHILDAGAGTGLCGPLLRPFARRLVGVDLSPAMLERAAERAVYDALEAAELTETIARHGEGDGERQVDDDDRLDVIASADTLVYFGDLSGVARAAVRALRPGGLLVFTVEHAEPEPPPPGYVLAHHGRYVHGEPYVRAALEAAGLAVVSIGYAQLRTEHLKPVAGLVVTAQRPA